MWFSELKTYRSDSNTMRYRHIKDAYLKEELGFIFILLKVPFYTRLYRAQKTFSIFVCNAVNVKITFYLSQVKERLRKYGHLQPLNIFLKQEIDRMQRVIGVVRTTLTDLKLAIEGTIIMSEVTMIQYLDKAEITFI